MFKGKQLTRVVLLFTLVLLLGTLGYYALFQGREPFFRCLYMTVISISTVGYGEVIPVSDNPVAAVYTMLLIVSGMGVLVYAAGTLTAFFVEGHLSGLLRRRRMQRQIDKLKGHMIVCGAGEVGLRVVEELLKNLNDLVVVDLDEQRRELLEAMHDSSGGGGKPAENALCFLQGDATDDVVLEHAGVHRASGLVSVLPSDKDNVMVTMSARMANAGLRIVSRFIEAGIERKLHKVGADATVSPNRIGGLRVASEMIRPSAVDFMDRMIRSDRGTFRIEEVPIRQGSKLEGKTIADCAFAEKLDLLVLALERTRGGGIEFNPGGSETLQAGMTVVVMGDVHNVRKARQL